MSTREPPAATTAEPVNRQEGEQNMGRNVTIGLGTLIIIIILVALLF